MDITTATPAQIDTALAEIQSRYYLALDRVISAKRGVEEVKGGLAKLAAGNHSYFGWDEKMLARAEATLAERNADLAAIDAEMTPYENEFVIRGGWTRAFLVTNSNGHVHRNMNCTTCFARTRYAWLTQFSDHDEREIVEAAGEKACTICYPSAPVDVLRRKSTIEDPAKREARIAREAAKAERDAKKAAKAITAVDGSPLRVDRGGWPENLDTLAKAKMWLTDGIGWGFGTHAYYTVEDGQRVAEAIAAKIGTTADIEWDAAKKRSAKRR